MTRAKVEEFAEEVIASMSNHGQIPTFSSRRGGLDLAEAYRVLSRLRAVFEARGERIIGRKIGFTNRQMWSAFGVEAPVWGYATDRTTRELAATPLMPLNGFSEPRIEPEIVLGLAAVPTPTMSDHDLLDCVEWIALGFEIVQSIFPNWEFAAADTVAANGLHGALLVGPRHALAPRKAEWQRELTEFEIELRCDGGVAQRGGGALVLDSPLNALRHLVELLAKDPSSRQLRAGEIVSTGTLTLAMPIKPGERWTATVAGIPLEEMAIRFCG